jgi:hypothetical protein
MEWPVWSEWRTVTREDGTTYEERECHRPAWDLYGPDGIPLVRCGVVWIGGERGAVGRIGSAGGEKRRVAWPN